MLILKTCYKVRDIKQLWEARNKLLFQRQLVGPESIGDLIGKYVGQTRSDGASCPLLVVPP